MVRVVPQPDDYSFNVSTGIYFDDSDLEDSNSEDSNDNIDDIEDEQMKIYLRLRPLVDGEVSPYTITEDDTVSAYPPKDSVNYKNLLHGSDKGHQDFTFSKILSENQGSQEIYNLIAKPMIRDFLKGGDRLLFAYGTTSGGKTYTMIGDNSEMGVIPRSLSSLFAGCKLSNDIKNKPSDYSSVMELKSADIALLVKEKEDIMKLAEKENCVILQNLSDTAVDKQLDVDNKDGYQTTFWMSFVEIYNEVIYDLLDVTSLKMRPSASQKFKRTQLEIRTAKTGGFYVKGAKCVPVFSAEEAYKTLLVGRRNQRVGSTRLNQHSSRSHSILTLRAVRSSKNSAYLTRVFNLSFCDLAGSERSTKAGTSGAKQKETSNINTSLLTLGRCLDLLRKNQTRQQQSIVPFRDSKLTRLFQNYLSGYGRAAMIVCVNQTSILFDETLQVLKFSAIARKIIMHEKKIAQPEQGASKNRNSVIEHLRNSGPIETYNDRLLRSLYNDLDENLTDEQFTQYLSDKLLKKAAEYDKLRMKKVIDERRLRDQHDTDMMSTVVHLEKNHDLQIKRMRREFQEYMAPAKKRKRMDNDTTLKDVDWEEEHATLQKELEETQDDLLEMVNMTEQQAATIQELETENINLKSENKRLKTQHHSEKQHRGTDGANQLRQLFWVSEDGEGLIERPPKFSDLTNNPDLRRSQQKLQSGPGLKRQRLEDVEERPCSSASTDKDALAELAVDIDRLYGDILSGEETRTTTNPEQRIMQLMALARQLESQLQSSQDEYHQLLHLVNEHVLIPAETVVVATATTRSSRTGGRASPRLLDVAMSSGQLSRHLHAFSTMLRSLIVPDTKDEHKNNS